MAGKHGRLQGARGEQLLQSERDVLLELPIGSRNDHLVGGHRGTRHAARIREGEHCDHPLVCFVQHHVDLRTAGYHANAAEGQIHGDQWIVLSSNLSREFGDIRPVESKLAGEQMPHEKEEAIVAPAPSQPAPPHERYQPPLRAIGPGHPLIERLVSIGGEVRVYRRPQVQGAARSIVGEDWFEADADPGDSSQDERLLETALPVRSRGIERQVGIFHKMVQVQQQRRFTAIHGDVSQQLLTGSAARFMGDVRAKRLHPPRCSILAQVL